MGILPRHLVRQATSEDIAELMAYFLIESEDADYERHKSEQQAEAARNRPVTRRR